MGISIVGAWAPYLIVCCIMLLIRRVCRWSIHLLLFGSGGKEVEGMMVAGSVGTKFESKEGGEGLEGMSVADGWWMFLKKAAEGECFVIVKCEKKSNDDGVGTAVRFNSKVKSCAIPLLLLRRIVNEPMKESTRKT